MLVTHGSSLDASKFNKSAADFCTLHILLFIAIFIIREMAAAQTEISTTNKKGYVVLFLKTALSLLFLYMGYCKVKPDLNPELFFLLDSKFRGPFGRVLQDFVKNILKSSYIVKPVSLKRTIGILELACVILLWVGNGAVIGGKSESCRGKSFVRYYVSPLKCTHTSYTALNNFNILS